MNAFRRARLTYVALVAFGDHLEETLHPRERRYLTEDEVTKFTDDLRDVRELEEEWLQQCRKVEQDDITFLSVMPHGFLGEETATVVRFTGGEFVCSMCPDTYDNWPYKD